jgi:hypothetical protein
MIIAERVLMLKHMVMIGIVTLLATSSNVRAETPAQKPASAAAVFSSSEELVDIQKIYLLVSDPSVLGQLQLGLRQGLSLKKVTFRTLRAGHVYRLVLKNAASTAVASFPVTTFETSSHPESIIGVGRLAPETPAL